MSEFGPGYLPWTSWELLRTGEIHLRALEQVTNLEGILDTIVVRRDDQYRISAAASGEPKSDAMESREPHVAGAEMAPLTVLAEDDFRNRYELIHCFPDANSESSRHVGGQTVPKWRSSLRPWQVVKSSPGDYSLAWLTDWFLNGPRHNVIYTRRVRWSVHQRYQRDIEDEPGGSILREFPSSTMSMQSALVSFGERKLLLSSVPSDAEPQWSAKVAIEYREEWGGVPPEGERQAIARLISFILGRRLLQVGTTWFNSEGIPYKAVSMNPGTFNPTDLCQQSESPPIPIVHFVNGLPSLERNPSGSLVPRLELTLGQLIPRYLAVRQQIDLDASLDRLLALQELYLGTDVAVMRTVLDVLVKSWFKSTSSKSGGAYLKGEAVTDLIGTELASIREKLAGRDYEKAVMNSMDHAFDISMTAGFYRFFDELKLPWGPVEKMAIGAGSAGAHTLQTNSAEAIRKAVWKRHALHALLNRVVLKLLDYDGPYLDRSALGWAERDVNEPMLGQQDA